MSSSCEDCACTCRLFFPFYHDGSKRLLSVSGKRDRVNGHQRRTSACVYGVRTGTSALSSRVDFLGAAFCSDPSVPERYRRVTTDMHTQHHHRIACRVVCQRGCHQLALVPLAFCAAAVVGGVSFPSLLHDTIDHVFCLSEPKYGVRGLHGTVQHSLVFLRHIVDHAVRESHLFAADVVVEDAGRRRTLLSGSSVSLRFFDHVRRWPTRFIKGRCPCRSPPFPPTSLRCLANIAT